MRTDCPIATGADHFGNRQAIATSGRNISYRELDRFVASAAIGLQRLGVLSGDRVGVRLGSTTDLPIVLWAIFRMGAVAVLLGDRDPEAMEMRKAKDLSCRIIVGGSTPKLESNHITALELLDAGADRELRTPVSLRPNAPATVVFTSGTTSRPKAVVHSLRNHWASSDGSQSVLPVTSSTRWAVTIPPHHVGGLSIFFRCFYHGGTVVLPKKTERTPKHLLALGATHLSVVPSQLGGWLAEEGIEELRSFEAILVGGSRFPRHLETACLESDLRVFVSYGSTEMASQIATRALGDPDSVVGDVGSVLPRRALRIEDGEVQTGGETLFLGYWRDGTISRPLGNQEWFNTGDRGYFDNLNLIITGRADNMFISGGENIFPEEIEQALISTGLVDDAIVVPMVDAKFGMRPIAFVRPFRAETELVDALRSHLPGFKIPDRFELLPDRFSGGKKDRHGLAAIVSGRDQV